MNKYPTQIRSDSDGGGDRRLSRRECLEFISYLKDKENVTIESRTEPYRAFFNTYCNRIDIIAKDALKIIKDSASPNQAYDTIAAQLAKKNTMWKTIPQFGYICREDLVEYLVSAGFSDEEAEELTTCIEGRGFKRSKWAKEEERRLSDDFKTWAGASGGELRTRDYLPNIFRLEWLEYIHKNTVADDTAFTVSELSTKGAYNGYRYLTSRLMGESDDGLVLGYRDNGHKLDKEKLIALAEYFMSETGMPEMWLRNMSEETVTVVKKRSNSQ